MTSITNVAFRQNALYLPEAWQTNDSDATLDAHYLEELARAGYVLSRTAWIAWLRLSATKRRVLYEDLRSLLGLEKNWMPLVRDWNLGYAGFDACTHALPFYLRQSTRYTGCPLCGIPFEQAYFVLSGAAHAQKTLTRWGEAEAKAYATKLLMSKVPLSATEYEDLRLLLAEFELPEVFIPIKEHRLLRIDAWVKSGAGARAQSLLDGPQDILRYLWYAHTGQTRFVPARVLVSRIRTNHTHFDKASDRQFAAATWSKQALKLKYNRAMCRQVAAWFSALPHSAIDCAKQMHAQRGTWVRLIRALRLVEYAKRPAFRHLQAILDAFHAQKYTVWEGQLAEARQAKDAARVFSLLQARPGVFARTLFHTITDFGLAPTLEAFQPVAARVPLRLILSVSMYASYYFNSGVRSIALPLGGRKIIPKPKAQHIYSSKTRTEIIKKIELFALEIARQQYATQAHNTQKTYIAPYLFMQPLPLGERGTQAQEFVSTQMGQRFALQGDAVHLFMQWGAGMPAQYLDMDLSCSVIYADRTEICFYQQTQIYGCQHSGDIRAIPDQVGTAEYITISLHKLQKNQAKYVVFGCNAYSSGGLVQGLQVGWMDSRYPIRIDTTTGVLYDPSAVQKQLRIEQTLQKGLVFGVLDVAKAEVIWLELPFHGQTIAALDLNAVHALLDKLTQRMSIGELLRIRAQAQQTPCVDQPQEAEIIYDKNWAQNPAEILALF